MNSLTHKLIPKFHDFPKVKRQCTLPLAAASHGGDSGIHRDDVDQIRILELLPFSPGPEVNPMINGEIEEQPTTAETR